MKVWARVTWKSDYDCLGSQLGFRLRRLNQVSRRILRPDGFLVPCFQSESSLLFLTRSQLRRHSHGLCDPINLLIGSLNMTVVAKKLRHQILKFICSGRRKMVASIWPNVTPHLSMFTVGQILNFKKTIYMKRFLNFFFLVWCIVPFLVYLFPWHQWIKRSNFCRL